jgi:protein-tyrosine-phosphatase
MRAARERGIDLAPHRSRCFGDLAGRPAFLFAFDRKTVEDYRDRHPDSTTPIFLLTDLLGRDAPAEIEDPYGRDLTTFTATYATIEQALGELTKLMAARTPRSRAES